MDHTCNLSKGNKKIIESKDDVYISLSVKQITAKAKELILRNIDKPFSFHKNNLIENFYKLSNNKINWLPETSSLCKTLLYIFFFAFIIGVHCNGAKIG